MPRKYKNNPPKWNSSPLVWNRTSGRWEQLRDEHERQLQYFKNLLNQTKQEIEDWKNKEIPDPFIPGLFTSPAPVLKSTVKVDVITPEARKPPRAIVLRKPGLIRRWWLNFIHWIW